MFAMMQSMPKTRSLKKSLSDKVTELKRESLLDAARTVFAERGYHRTTIKDIAAQAGVADGTVYNYFENKDALLSALFDRFQNGGAPSPGSSMESALGPDMLSLVRIMLSEMLVDEDLRERYRDRFLAPLAALPSANTGDALASRTTAATMLGLILLRLLGDPVVNKHWDRMPALLMSLVKRPG
jgi:AcrR family transcriptional regulator